MVLPPTRAVWKISRHDFRGRRDEIVSGQRSAERSIKVVADPWSRAQLAAHAQSEKRRQRSGPALGCWTGCLSVV
jgi:hypothetical protein